jgi:glycosyltransferase involved in cell wall biosynthesis
MKVGILLSGRYPTEKAYGVTTNGTVQSLLDLGHQVIVFGIVSNYIEDRSTQDNLTILNYEENFAALFLKRVAFKRYRKVNAVAWFLYWKCVKYINKNSISKLNLDILWIRNLQMLDFSFAASFIVLEIHQLVKKSKLMRSINRSSPTPILLAPISKILYQDLMEMNTGLSLTYAPMGVDSRVIASPESTVEFITRLREKTLLDSIKIDVGYVGKFFPDGYSKGVEDIIKLAKENRERKGKLRISLTGGMEKEISQVNKLAKECNLSSKDLEIKSYVGFPVKCIEAIATGRIVIAAKCMVYDQIFTEKYQPYWYESGNENSLYASIQRALSDEDLEARINLGLEFALQFTWDIRISNILRDCHKDKLG